jgi:hypothetical protein
VQNLLLSVLNRLPLNVVLLVLAVDLNLHAKDIPLKPTKLLDFSSHGSSSSLLLGDGARKELWRVVDVEQ